MITTQSQQDYVKIITDLINERFKGSCYCFFYGSAARGEWKPNSDIDIIIVYDKTVASYRERFFFKGLLMDVIVYDEESLSGTLHMSRMNGKFVTCNAVCSAITLPGPTKNSENLKVIAKRVREAGYIFSNRKNVQLHITNILDDLEDVTVASEINMLCVDLFKAVAEVILIGGGEGICDRKHAARKLTSINIKLHQRLDGGLLSALSGNIGPLVEVAKEILAIIGGPVRDEYHQGNPNVVRMPLPVL